MIALVTAEEYPELEPDSQRLLPALADRGMDAEPVVWTDESIDWSVFDAIVVRSPWDYFLKAVEWASWLERVEATGVPMFNSTKVVRWNSHKSLPARAGRCRRARDRHGDDAGQRAHRPGRHARGSRVGGRDRRSPRSTVARCGSSGSATSTTPRRGSMRSWTTATS